MEVESKVVEIKEGMKKLYNWYEKMTLEHEEAEVSNVETSKNKDKNGKRSMELSEALDSEFDQHMEEETNMVSKSELERYWLETMEDRKNEKFDLLTWWFTNCTRYRILSQMARDILAIPVSTIASESAFSTGGRILDPYRTSLSPKMAEALICAQNWLRYPCEISLRDMLDEVEELESVVLEANLEESCVTEEGLKSETVNCKVCWNEMLCYWKVCLKPEMTFGLIFCCCLD
ncbi:hypothetical protein RHMOL_Rhmol07G0235900 [Rhododendron molle]|uniref:Uncharacterized protein n=3 Tax=Rhododendron molle TaxID=49168 RepID=A0ACC0N462_RHOML|nr:hypothetical protein RHMOL_Rhmol07G0235900 [Rhododendron molle]KAI8547961.1 hypothetical protein RHMOL_Rhmol07G0235900 [Rhododendron molle]KAI8547964.1 hypothetical protein RHMOL_Rhmol07G0235900 [Rhododendron molle]